MNTEFWQERLAACQLQVAAYEDASLALASGQIQSYTLDTGQTRQTVTKLDLEWINTAIDSLLNRCATIEARLNGAALQTRPAW